MPTRRARDLSLRWKLLLPFLGLIVLFGSLGAFFVVNDLSTRAQAGLERDLERRSFEARSRAHDRELYLVESANFATNIQGMPAAIARRDRRTVETLLGSVLALKTDLNLLVAVDPTGVGVVELRRSDGDLPPESSAGGAWKDHPFVAAALRDATGGRHAGLLRDGAATLLVIAAPICGEARPCALSGAAVVGIDVARLTRDAVGASASNTGRDAGGASLYDADGTLLASAGLAGDDQAPAPPGDGRMVRSAGRVAGREVATLYAPLEVQGARIGTLASSVASGSAFASVRGTALRLGVVVFLVMVGVTAVGVLLSRFLLAQLKPLVETNRALGRGDLSARTPVVSGDELGELALGVNQMADQLQASYETLELRVAQRTEEVRRLLEERTEFFASMSHDLRTPLAVIRSQALMMLDPTFEQHSPSQSAETIVASSNQLLDLINELLELSKAEAGRLDIDIERVRLDDVLQDLAPTIRGLAQAAGIEVSTSIPKGLPALNADPRRLREILLNLVDNAVKYTPRGGAVALTAIREDGDVAVLVTDNGIGIPDGASEKLFEPFSRVKGNDPQHGQASTGLGLALTKRLVEAQGGAISFVRHDAGGTTFRVTVPTAPAASRRGAAGRPVPVTRARSRVS